MPFSGGRLIQYAPPPGLVGAFIFNGLRDVARLKRIEGGSAYQKILYVLHPSVASLPFIFYSLREVERPSFFVLAWPG